MKKIFLTSFVFLSALTSNAWGSSSCAYYETQDAVESSYFQMSTHASASGTVAYNLSFNQRDTKRPLVILIPGIALYKSLAHFQNLLVQNGFPVLTIEIPGKMGTGLTSIPTSENLASKMKEVIDVLKLSTVRRPLIVGHSMGATVAARLAVLLKANNPDLILFNPLGLDHKWPLMTRISQIPPMTLIAPLMLKGTVFGNWKNEIACPQNFPELFNRQANEFLNYDKKKKYFKLMSELIIRNHKMDYEAIQNDRIRSLLVSSELDPFQDQAIQALRLIPSAGVEIIPGAGHMSLMEQPRISFEVLDSFVNGVEFRKLQLQ